ncbi:MAG: HNH endonuclease signature motif containing protein [Anaerolineae bacterium]
MTYIPQPLRRQVMEQAQGCCEYCRLRADDNFLAHEIDHIRPEKHGGKTVLENLCYCCFDCNRHKGSDVGSFDSETDLLTAFFNPRKQQWREHFKLDDLWIVPLTAEGRVTVRLLQMNSEDRLIKRAELIPLGFYPCE